jgi:hypothetical protein
MDDLLNEFVDGGFDSKFLAKFANKTTLERFTRFHLAAGEFPETREMPASRPLRYQKLSLPKQKRGGYINDLSALLARASC